MTTIKPGIQEDGTWCVPTFKVQKLKDRVDVLNRRVKKTGGAGLYLAMFSTLTRELPLGEGEITPRVESWTLVRVAGDVPRVDGWDFVARVEHHAGVGNIISRAPGAEAFPLPDSLRTDDAICEHCATKRVRNDTFVLAKDGATKRVGRNCLADFLRGVDPADALRLWSILSSVRSLLSEAAEEGYGGSGSGKRGFGTVGFLACTVSAIRHGGWLSKAACNGTDKVPTAATAAWLADRAPNNESSRLRWQSMQPAEADYEEAGEVVAWAQALPEAQMNDYLSNLQVAVSLGYVEKRHEGIVASGVAARRRDVEKALEAAREAARNAARPPSEHVGAVGKRYDFRGLTVTSAKSVSGFYGPSTLLIMEDQDGCELKTFLSGGDCQFKAGDVLGGKATVKAHEAHKGRKQTVLVRCKLETGLPVQGSLIPKVTAAPAAAPDFADEEIPFSMKKAYFIDYSGSVTPSQLSKMASMCLELEGLGHEVYLLDAGGALRADRQKILDLAAGKFWGGGSAMELAGDWERYETTFLTDGDVMPSVLARFDYVLTVSCPKSDLVHEVMNS